MTEVQTIKRAFAISKTIAAQPGNMGLTKIARQLDVPKSTVARMLSTLKNIQAVERDPDSGRFRTGSQIMALVSQISYAQNVFLKRHSEERSDEESPRSPLISNDLEDSSPVPFGCSC